MTYLELDWTAAVGSVYLSRSSASYEGAKLSEGQWIALKRENFQWVALTLSPLSTEALRLAMMQNTCEELELCNQLAKAAVRF